MFLALMRRPGGRRFKDHMEELRMSDLFKLPVLVCLDSRITR